MATIAHTRDGWGWFFRTYETSFSCCLKDWGLGVRMFLIDGRYFFALSVLCFHLQVFDYKGSK